VTRLLVALSIAWPLLLGATVWLRAADRAPWVTGLVYLAAGRVCHQQGARSFHTAGVQWPVCGRCSGLYLAAPFGALAAWAGWRRRIAGTSFRVLAGAAFPTAATLLWEWLGGPTSSVVRMLAALPLGAYVAVLVVRATQGAAGPIR
jgi:uncharacterized membrane protein